MSKPQPGKPQTLPIAALVLVGLALGGVDPARACFCGVTNLPSQTVPIQGSDSQISRFAGTWIFVSKVCGYDQNQRLVITNQSSQLVLQAAEDVRATGAVIDGSDLRVTLEIEGETNSVWIRNGSHNVLTLHRNDSATVQVFERLTLRLKLQLATRSLQRLVEQSVHAVRAAPEVAVDFLSRINSRTLDDLSRAF